MQDNQNVSAFDGFVKGRQRAEQVSGEIKWVARTLRALFLIVSTVIVAPMELLLRHRFGERYLGLFTVVGAAVIAAFATDTLSDLLQRDMPPEMIQVWGLINGAFVLLVLGAGAAHLVLIAVRTRQGVRWHSRSDGLPLPIWRKMGLKEGAVRLYIEPAACLAVAFVLLIPAMPLALFVAIMGFFMWVNELVRRRQQRGELLELIDGQIEAEERQKAMQGAPSVETKGFSVRGMQPRTAAERRTLKEMIAGLGQPIRRMMVAETDGPGRPDEGASSSPPGA